VVRIPPHSHGGIALTNGSLLPTMRESSHSSTRRSRVQQFVNAGSQLRLQPEKAQRYVITGRATGRVTEVIVEAGQSHVVSADTESLRVEAFEATPQKSANPEGGIDFRLTQT
jgi:hypothetical protein